MNHIIYQSKTQQGAGKLEFSDFNRFTSPDNCNFIYDLEDSDIASILSCDIVIFVYNEDGLFLEKTFNEDIERLLEIEKMVALRTEHIYNRPSYYKLCGCKSAFYKSVIGEMFCPKFCELDNPDDIDKITSYPCLLILSIRCLGKQRFLCKNKKQAEEAFSKLNKVEKIVNYEKICAIEFLNSYVPRYKCYLNIRFMVFNDKIVEYYSRPAGKWNVHNDDQTRKIKIHDMANEDLEKWLVSSSGKEQLGRLLDICYQRLGKGFYAYDCIIENIGDPDKSRLYLCEVGLKMMNNTTKNFYRKLHKNYKKKIMYYGDYARLLLKLLKTDTEETG